MKKVTLLAGMLLTLSAATLRAQNYDITSYLPDDGEDYRGYCIERARFDNIGEGYLVAGSRTESDKIHNTIHLMGIRQDEANTSQGQLLHFPEYEDVRAIALSMIEANRAVLLIQATDANRYTHPVLVLLDCSNAGSVNIIDKRQFTGEVQFPTSMCLSPDRSRIYVAGFSTPSRAEQGPTFVSQKMAFVTSVDANSLSLIGMKQYNTAQFDEKDKDYDMIQRISFINERLYVVGSVNDKASGYTSSKVWVAQLDQDGLGIVQQSQFGNDAFSPNGFQGVDIVPNAKDPKAFYVVGNDYYWHTWICSRINSSSLQIMPGSGSYKNTITYGYSADIKGCGILSQQTGRISVYGNMRAGYPAAPANVASFNDGAVPFIASFDPAIDPTNGLKAGNLSWYNEGNLPSTATSLPGRYTPYWLNTDLSYWGIPAFAILSNPEKDLSGLAIMGHVGYKLPNLAPRLIESNENGATKCDGSVDVTKDVEPGVVGIILNNIKIAVSERDNKFEMQDLKIEPSEMPHKVLNCRDDFYYRQSQTTGIAATGSSKLALQGLSPNPATNAVTLRWNGNLEANDAISLELTDIAGRKVGNGYLQSRTSASGTFALPELAPGMYIASLYVNGKAAGQQKLSIK